MPTLEWIGKDKVVNHHQEVPFRILDKKYTFNAEHSENMIIHGDNLLALKSLLPQYEGLIDCIYIDPPYNTGNEKWVYNDNVNDPRIKKWLGQVVGTEGEDLSRHDKWLCMIYPRLKLLHKLLAKDGIIFISIDDIEYVNLKCVCDEIFGASNRIATLVWKKRYNGAKEKRVIVVQEYILMYVKDLRLIDTLDIPYTEEMIARNYVYEDEYVNERGKYRTQPLEAGNSMGDRENLRFPITAPDGSIIMPRRQWIWSKEHVEEALKYHELGFSQRNGTWSVFIKQYLKDRQGIQRTTRPFSLIDNVFTQDGTREMQEIFGNGNEFPFPKPTKLIEQLLTMACKKENALFLDSFGGSATTAHSLLKMNKNDNGKRRFILVEMMDYAETLTAERIKRVIKGYGSGKKKVDGVPGDFTYYELGQPLFKDDKNLNEEVPEEEIRKYVYYMETKKPLDMAATDNPYLLGKNNDTAYYFFYKKDEITTLNNEFLSTINTRATEYIIYADKCVLSEEIMEKFNIVFKKIPRDITRL
ncbi:MAG: site-specific DNA-methyltransferase [Clostridia bacterium]|nr:site-specific DNA-methyltransferase [Clostridia bacterium]